MKLIPEHITECPINDKDNLYYPIKEVCEQVHCSWQKAVDTLRALHYSDFVSIKKQGCGKPNRIYSKYYVAVPNADFKESGCGTPDV